MLNKVIHYKSGLFSVIAAYAAITMLVAFPVSGSGADEKTTHIVNIRNLVFDPQVIEVQVGDIVRWVNHDFIPHTATADDKSWDSQLIETDKQWEMVVDRDTFQTYYCIYHPGMKGALIITN